MAMTSISKTVLNFSQAVTMPQGSSIDVTDGAALAYDKNDGSLLLIFSNTGSSQANVTVKKGDSVMAAGNDLTFTVQASQTVVMVIESGRYIVTSGENKGKVIFAASAAGVTMAAVAIPA